MRLFLRHEATRVYDLFQKAYRDHRNTKRREEKRFLKVFIAWFNNKQPVIDIERKLEGIQEYRPRTRQWLETTKSAKSFQNGFELFPTLPTSNLVSAPEF